MGIYIEKKYQKTPLGAVVEDSMTSGSTVNAPSINAVQNAFSNPNLLINGDFQVNQRGATSVKNLNYGFDRWYLDGSSTSGGADLEYVDGKLKVSNINGTRIGQPLEQSIVEQLKGKTITLSMKFTGDGEARLRFDKADGGLVVGTDYNACRGTSGTLVHTITVPEDCTSIIPGFDFVGGTEYYVEYVKLEQGSLATPFVPRPYAEELVLCQRYFQRAFICIPVLNNQGGYYEFPIEMRSVPTVTYDSVSFGIAGSAMQTAFGSATLYVSSVTVDRIIFAQGFRDAVVALRCLAYCDAEIY